MDPQVTCSICTQSLPVVFCLCQPFPACLCQVCISTHCGQVPTGLHDFCTMADWRYVMQITPDVYKKRKLSIAQGLALMEVMQKQEAEDHVKVVARMENLFQQVKFLVDSLHNTLAMAFGELRKNVESALYAETNPEMIDFILGNGQVMQTLRLDLYQIQVLSALEACRESTIATISSFQTRDFASYILTKMKEEFLNKGSSSLSLSSNKEKDEPYIPVLKCNMLRKYYASESGKLSLIEYAYSTRVDQESSYALMQSGELFCCGGLKAGKQCYYIGTYSSKVTILPLMNHGRSCPGVISYNNLPYVFGGRNGSLSLSSCERFTPTDTWELFPTPMNHPRCSFSPVVYNSLIYLPGGVNTSMIEVFEPVKMSFRRVALTLPYQGSNLSFANGDSLYVLVGSDLMHMDLRNEIEGIHSTTLKTDIVTWSPIAPIVSNGKVLFWGFEDTTITNFFRRTFGGSTHGISYTYDIEKKTVKQVERFEYLTSED